MGENTRIEWPHHTFNPIIGCTKKSEGCKNCYAEEMMDHRYGRAKWGANGTRVRTSVDNWKKPYTWNRKAAKLGERHRVFCASLSDVFEDHPAWVEPRRDLLKLIVETPNLDWLLLTKRPENVLSMIEEAAKYAFDCGDTQTAVKWMVWLKHGSDHALPNVWVGASTENQKTFDQRVPELLKIPAKVRFLSMEPLLGSIDFKIVSNVDGLEVTTDSLRGEVSINGQAYLPCRKIDWVIVGDFDMGAMDGDTPMYRLGKHKTGRLLDGQEWNQFPK